MNMRYDHIRVTPLATSVGAKISGVDLAGPRGAAELAEIRRALGEYGVVFFRDQQLTPEQHIAFARCFGRDQCQPILCDRAGLLDDRRVRKGTRAAAQYLQ
jgi:alpha-ketoglutarate-dependent taurine dioxygenase